MNKRKKLQFFFSGGSPAPVEPRFTMEVDTAATGVSNADQFQTTGAEGTYNLTAKKLDTGVEQLFENQTGQQTFTFLEGAGVYHVFIEPTGATPFHKIRFANSGDARKVNKIKSFGDVVWSSFINAFNNCGLTELPSTGIKFGQNVTTFRQSFRSNSIGDIPAGLFDNCPNVTDMSLAFIVGGITSIPAGLFDNCPNISTFNNTFGFNPFNDLPVGLFNPCTNVSTYIQCFNGITLLVDTLSRLYIELESTSVRNNVDFTGGNGKYDPNFTLGGLTTQQARDNLIARGWTLSDGGPI